MLVEYIMVGGNENVVFCERGIRIFEIYIRNILDLSVILVVKKFSYLLVIVDLSYVVGKLWMVDFLFKVVIVVGVDGLIIEVYNDLVYVFCDGK